MYFKIKFKITLNFSNVRNSDTKWWGIANYYPYDFFMGTKHKECIHGGTCVAHNFSESMQCWRAQREYKKYFHQKKIHPMQMICEKIRKFIH